MPLLLSFKLDLSRGGVITEGNTRDIKVWVPQDGQLHCHVLNVQSGLTCFGSERRESKYCRLCRPAAIVGAIQASCCDPDSATDSVYVSDRAVTLELCFQNQGSG